ncbi:hypothetical protein IQ268_27990 [Oculatella sp. LEGE 06141]|uniref:hypothetical protein n=1 Tax=Oculatella sp. LEGE 06141 TaxID=1828648 RepID=UPI0018827819|nr:hypothetical protein [Oculatella sp. LEGE 06141]MBE9182393.1 hypothetical protein [Oculatella sp. LEGE 06141]
MQLFLIYKTDINLAMSAAESDGLFRFQPEECKSSDRQFNNYALKLYGFPSNLKVKHIDDQ